MSAGQANVQSRPLDLDLEPPVALSGSLLDAVDRLMEKGAAVRGQVLLSIADVDLVLLDLRFLLSAVETVEQALIRANLRERGEVGGGPPGERARATARAATAPSVVVPPAAPASPTPLEAPAAPLAARPERVSLDPDAAEKGLARLVLTLVEFLRRLLERQAIRRMEGGLLAEDSVERMGVALERLEGKVLEMKKVFGLEGEDLDLDLGPLGRLSGPSDQDLEPPRGD